jgi:hypothetical protein
MILRVRCRMPDAGCRIGCVGRGWLAVLLLVAGAVFAQAAAPVAEPPVPPLSKSPVEFFRRLLVMSPEERTAALTNRSDKAQRIILSRINEYSAMPRGERELRLGAMHLRWLLLPMMRTGPAERAQFIAGLSPEDRSLVGERLRRWEGIPAGLQAQFLEHEAAIDYFTRIQNSPLPPMPPGLSPEMDDQRRRLETGLNRWNSLSGADRSRMIGQFRDFFELGPQDLAKGMDHLKANERRLLDAARDRFGGLPVAQRREYMLAFERLAEMSSEQRAHFLRNVERWESMTAAERNVWRQLTKQVPELPPFPPGMFPPLPPGTNSVAAVSH